MKAEKIIKKAILDFWKDSGKEWSCQTMTNEDMKRHCGFKNCLDMHVKAALADLTETVRRQRREEMWRDWNETIDRVLEMFEWRKK